MELHAYTSKKKKSDHSNDWQWQGNVIFGAKEAKILIEDVEARVVGLCSYVSLDYLFYYLLRGTCFVLKKLRKFRKILQKF